MGGNHIYVKDTQNAVQLLVLHGLFHGNLPFHVESKSNAFSNSAFLTSSKPIFHTESSASKPNAFTETAPSTSLTALSTSSMALSTSVLTYSHWHKAFDHVHTFAQNTSFYEDGEILLNFIKYNC